jgi:hypothetical protein
MTTCATPGCGRTYLNHHLRCSRCRKELTARGLCAHCGVEPKQAGRHSYCVACQRLLETASEARMGEIEVLPEPPRAKYRGQDAREKTHETKHGTWHG